MNSPRSSDPLFPPRQRVAAGLLSALLGIAASGLVLGAVTPLKAEFGTQGGSHRSNAHRPLAPLRDTLIAPAAIVLAQSPSDAADEEHYVLTASWQVPPVAAPVLSPVGLALDDAGFLYVADRGAGEVRVLSAAGAVVDAWSAPASSEPAHCRFAPLDVLFDKPVKVPANRTPSIYVAWEPLVAGCSSLIHQRAPHGAPQAVNRITVGQSSSPDHLVVDPLTGERVEYPWSAEEDPVMVANLQAAVLTVRGSPPERTVRMVSLANGSTIRTIDLGASVMPLAITSDPVRQRFAILTIDRGPETSDGYIPRIVEVDIHGQIVGTVELRTLGVGALAIDPGGAPIPWDWRLATNTNGSWVITHSAPDITIQRIWPSEARRVSIVTASRAGGSGAPDPMLPPTWGSSTEVAALPSGGAVVLDRQMRRIVSMGRDGRAEQAYALPPGDHHALVVTGPAEIEVAYRSSGGGRRTGSLTTSDQWRWLRLSLSTGAVTDIIPAPAVITQLRGLSDRRQRVTAHGSDRFIAQTPVCAIARSDAMRTRMDDFVTCPFTEVKVWPDDIAVLSDGSLVALDVLSRTITVWSLDGSLQRSLAVGSSGIGYAVTAGKSASGEHRIVVAESGAGMAVYDPDSGGIIDRFHALSTVDSSVYSISFDMSWAGDIYVAASDAATIFVYSATTVRPSPTPKSTALAPSPRDCYVDGTKAAAPSEIVLGMSSSIELGVQIVCPDAQRPVGADIVLLIDRSFSMRSSAQFMTATLRSLLTQLHWSTDRVSVIDFDIEAIVRLIQASSADEVLRVMYDATLELQAPTTRISKALDEADTLLRAHGRPDAVPVVLVMSDGALADIASGAIPRAALLRARGTMLLAVPVIAWGSDSRLPQWTALTGRADRVWIQPTGADILSIAGAIRRAVYGSIAGDVAIEDELGDTMSLIPDSAVPQAVVGVANRTLYWHRAVLPSDGITLTYRVQPQQAGRWPTNRRAVARYHDAEGRERSFTFPVPFVNVITPTPSPSPVPEPTSAAPRVFLPVALTESCLPALAPVDLVLVVDTSASMGAIEPDGRSRLQSARDAIAGLLDLLDIPVSGPPGAHRAAVIDFNADATLRQPLTGERRALDAALADLRLGSGTRLDRAMLAAHDEALGRRHRTHAGAVVVLLSDGQVDAAVAASALVAANTAKTEGITIYTIALGEASDAAALRDVASAGAYFSAASGAHLDAIYRRIASLAPCPTSTYWWRR